MPSGEWVIRSKHEKNIKPTVHVLHTHQSETGVEHSPTRGGGEGRRNEGHQGEFARVKAWEMSAMCGFESGEYERKDRFHTSEWRSTNWVLSEGPRHACPAI